MRSYREAQQVTDALEDLGVLLRFACMWDPKAYKRRHHTVAGLRRDTQLIRCMRLGDLSDDLRALYHLASIAQEVLLLCVCWSTPGHCRKHSVWPTG